MKWTTEQPEKLRHGDLWWIRVCEPRHDLVDGPFEVLRETVGQVDRFMRDRHIRLPGNDKNFQPAEVLAWGSFVGKATQARKPPKTVAEDPWKPQYCKRGLEGCYCERGFPYEAMCLDCRDGRAPWDIYSRCVCPPKDEE